MASRIVFLTTAIVLTLSLTTPRGVAGTRPDDAQDDPAVGTIRGGLVDQDGEARRIAGVAVFLCEAKSAFPIVARDGKPLGRENATLDMSEFRHGITDDRGEFEFKSIPAGTYRLVAQSWGGSHEIPDHKQSNRTLVVHGAADDVEVTADQLTNASIASLGESVITIRNNPAEGNAFLFVSTEAPIGEPVVAYYGWGDAFTHNIVGMTHMKEPVQTIVGLPDDADVHFSLLNYDNNPGVGGGSFHTGRDTVGVINIYATWSNGYHKTPDRLVPLVNRLAENQLSELLPPDVRDVLVGKYGLSSSPEALEYLQKYATEKVEIAGSGQWRLIDVAAAVSYKRVSDSHKARLKQ